MEIPVEGRNFRLVKNEELYSLLHQLEDYLPESLKFHQTLKTYLEDNVWNFYFYISKRWPKEPICLHFPGITQSEGDIFASFALFCPTNKLKYLRSVQEENILINWKRKLYVHYVHSSVMAKIETFYSEIGCVTEKCYGDFYIHCAPSQISLATPRFVDSSVQFRLLQKKDAKTVHDLYPANSIESVEIFEKLIEQLPSYGVYVEDELVSWMMQSYYGAMFAMHTKSRYRRQGFGRFVAQYLTRLVACRGYLPFVLVRSHNSISRCLYENLGFTRLYTNVRAAFKPYNM